MLLSVDAKPSGDSPSPWEALSELGLQERHFNTICAQYRVLASTWLLATFAGVAFIIKSAEGVLPLTKAMAVASIGAASSIGMLTLWLLDLGVYQLLLRAAFDEGLTVEREHPELPQVRHRMLEQLDGVGVGPRISVFWRVLTSVGVLIVGLGLVWQFEAALPGAVAIGILTLAAILAQWWFMGRRWRRS